MDNVAYIEQRTEIDFLQNKDGTTTLVITCPKGNEIKFKMKERDVEKLEIPPIEKIMDKECK